MGLGPVLDRLLVCNTQRRSTEQAAVLESPGTAQSSHIRGLFSPPDRDHLPDVDHTGKDIRESRDYDLFILG